MEAYFEIANYGVIVDGQTGQQLSIIPRMTDLLTTLNDHLVKRSRGHPLAMYIAERGRPTARSVYHPRWVLYGRPSWRLRTILSVKDTKALRSSRPQMIDPTPDFRPTYNNTVRRLSHFCFLSKSLASICWTCWT